MSTFLIILIYKFILLMRNCNPKAKDYKYYLGMSCENIYKGKKKVFLFLIFFFLFSKNVQFTNFF